MLIAIAIILQAAALTADTTSTSDRQLDEVVVVSDKAEGQKRSYKGQTATIDEHLRELSHVDLVRRGSYAWEPTINGMQTERLSVTIDGMKIFYACTDKMDPVTSYVESGNLQNISLSSGLDGNPQATGNIGGSLDLRLRRVGFDRAPRRTTVSAGYEANGHLQTYGADTEFSGHNAYINFGAFYRHADDYRAGHHEKIPFSQFKKINAFGNFGFRIRQHQRIEGTLIYDRAGDVGYPALNMDVSVAEAIITSLSHHVDFPHGKVNSWETKIYYNRIRHEMDDTHRPDVTIHMDMPGRSKTAGLYSLLAASLGCHSLRANYDLYYNRLFADMTMYPGGAAPMYMVTWPDVGTFNTGLALTDDINLSASHSFHLSAKAAWQQQRLNNEEGYKAQKVFFPRMTDSYSQTTARVALRYQWTPQHLQALRLSAGGGWGSRAPTVTEAYGYYLNNTFDRYDYMGNPHLKNESAIEATLTAKYSLPTFSVTADANAFFFSNYIIGGIENRLSPMTIGAAGVKVYGNIPHATILNATLTLSWTILPSLLWTGKLTYSHGRDDAGDTLPLVAPFGYASSLRWLCKALSLQLSMTGAARQSHYGAKYGESSTAAYTVFNLSAEYPLEFSHLSVKLRAGVENLLDRRYSTYADWNNIPQKGRNIYVSSSLVF